MSHSPTEQKIKKKKRQAPELQSFLGMYLATDVKQLCRKGSWASSKQDQHASAI